MTDFEKCKSEWTAKHSMKKGKMVPSQPVRGKYLGKTVSKESWRVMNQPYRMQPQRPPQQIQVQVDLQKDIIVCPECDGIGLLMNGAFLPKAQPIVGAEPQVVNVPLILCNQCGKRLLPPFRTAGEAKEA